MHDLLKPHIFSKTFFQNKSSDNTKIKKSILESLFTEDLLAIVQHVMLLNELQSLQKHAIKALLLQKL